MVVLFLGGWNLKSMLIPFFVTRSLLRRTCLICHVWIILLSKKAYIKLNHELTLGGSSLLRQFVDKMSLMILPVRWLDWWWNVPKAEKKPTNNRQSRFLSISKSAEGQKELEWTAHLALKGNYRGRLQGCFVHGIGVLLLLRLVKIWISLVLPEFFFLQ